MSGQEFMGFFNDDNRRSWFFAGSCRFSEQIFLCPLNSTQDVGNDKVANLRRVGVREVDNGDLAGLYKVGIPDGRSLGIIKNLQAVNSPEAREHRQPALL